MYSQSLGYVIEIAQKKEGIDSLIDLWGCKKI